MEPRLSDQEWRELLAILRDSDAEEEEQDNAAERLMATTDPLRVPDLYALLREKGNFWLRELAAEPLARLEGIRALPAFLEARQLGRQERHDNDGLDTILVSLLTSYPQEATPLLIHLLADLKSPHRREAVWALGFLPRELALEPLLQAVQDTVPEIRAEAANALCSASYMSHETITTLLQALRDPVSAVRLAAAYALGSLSVSDAAPATLQDTLAHLTGSLGEAARKGIEVQAQIKRRGEQLGS